MGLVSGSQFYGLFILLLLLGVPGCGKQVGRPQVTGKVTYQGKSVGNKTLFLKYDASAEESFSQMLPLRSDGTFAAEVPKPGKYKVVIAESLASIEGNVAQATAGKQINVPDKYKDASTSDLTVTIESGPNTLNIELKD